MNDGDREFGWGDLLSEGRGMPTLVLNLGLILHATVVFIVATVMPAVVTDIGGVAFYAWVTMLYMLGSIIGAVGAGRIAQRMSSRLGFVLGALIFVVGAVTSAMAPNMAILLVGRAFQGYGGGLIVALSYMLVREIYAPGLRTRALSTLSATWTTAALVGPMLGGAAAEFGWWRGAFWITVPVGLLVVWLSLRSLPPTARSAVVARFPLIRTVLLGSGVLCVGLAGNVDSIAVKASLIVAAAVLVLWSFRLDAGTDNRLFPSQAISFGTTVGAGFWMIFLTSISYTAINVFLPLILQVLHGIGPLVAGYFNGVLSIAWAVGTASSAGWRGRGEQLALAGGPILTAIGLAGLTFGIADISSEAIVVFVILTGLGLGACNLHITTRTMAAAATGEESVTATSQATIRYLGVAFGSAGVGIIANAAGLAEGITRATVADAAFWIFASNLLAALGAFVCAARVIWLGRTRRAMAE